MYWVGESNSYCKIENLEIDIFASITPNLYLCTPKTKNILIMKKLFAIMVALATIVAFASCNKNDDNKDSLVGTSWSANVGNGVTGTIEFTTETACKMTESYQDQSMSINGTYVYNAPNVSLSFPQESVTVSGTINGNKMTLTGDGETIVFTKK